jgi:hypothetical protein
MRSNYSNSGYSSHILNTGHKYGTITGTMDILRIHRKEKHWTLWKNTTRTRLAKMICK